MFHTYLAMKYAFTISFLHTNHQWFCIIHLVYNTIQIFYPNFRYFFRVLKLLRIHDLKQQLCQIFFESFQKSCVSVLLFCYCCLNINIALFKQYCVVISPLNSNPLSYWRPCLLIQHLLRCTYICSLSKTLWGTLNRSNWCCSLGFVK